MSKFLAPDPQKIGRPPGPAFPDAVPEALLHGTPEALNINTIQIITGSQ